MRQTFKSIAEINDGKMMEEMNIGLSKIMASINDPNADAKKGASMTVKIKFKPSENKQYIVTSYMVEPKLCPMVAKEVTLLNTVEVNKETGEAIPVLKEFNGQAKGQIDWDGNINEPVEILYGIDSEKCIEKEEIKKIGGQ